ncbi:hypothetical protein [Rhodococcus sp. 1168]|uniref:hypothetical protein n=1 Tax=Rhodococcus sp. 1168 TaxID=2018041 RepID=UPI000A0A5914|nr:hypothetical protein [Rhodococcus sp. 1168]ORI13458.1 hypothetical protein BJI47_22710 [Rhodococcus sp. 1168]
MTTIVLPYQRPPLTSNQASRSTGRAHARAKKQMRWTAALLAKSMHIRSHPRSDVLLTWYVPNLHRRDAGSLSVLLKHTLDGLVDAGVWPDDHFGWVRTEACRIDLDRANPRIELTITEAL